MTQLNGTGPGCVTRPRLQQDLQSFPSDDPDVINGARMDSVSICYRVEWLAEYMHVSKKSRSRGLAGPPSWMGSLVEGGRDPSGQMHMRNRFYDPTTGRFTQEDPIGLAGGINLYGFAGGDPVNFSDPYGLRPCYQIRAEIRTRINNLGSKVKEYVQAHARGKRMPPT